MRGATEVGPGCHQLHVVHEPPSFTPGPVRRQLHPAGRRRDTRSAPAEDVDIAVLEVVVAVLHHPAPPHQVRDAVLDAIRSRQGDADRRVRACAVPGPRFHAQRVMALARALRSHAAPRPPSRALRSRTSNNKIYLT